MRFFKVLLFAFLIFSCSARSEQEIAVQRMFEDYQSALLSQDEDVAANLVSSKTINYYSSMLENARNSTKEEIKSFSFLDMMVVIRIRAEFSAEEINNMTGMSLLQHGIEQGWIDKESTSKFKVTKVTIKDEYAAINFKSGTQNVPFAFDAYKENEIWKLDLTSVFPYVNIALEKQISDAEMTREQMLDLILKGLGYGEGLQESFWKPISD